MFGSNKFLLSHGVTHVIAPKQLLMKLVATFVFIRRILHPYDVLEAQYGSDIRPGGYWFPSRCQPEQRIAIIICYRNREQHFKILLDNLHPFLQQQQLDYTIFVVNQHGQELFNRGALFNIGFIEAKKYYPFTCFIFHDVDLLPEDTRNIYTCADQPRHMSVAMDKFDYKLVYSTFFGGVTAFKTDDFLGTNGYSNVYWGWGGEDDDMYSRVVHKLKKPITRYPIEIARYKMIRSNEHISAPANPHRFEILRSQYDFKLDGINTIQYRLLGVTFYKLFTLVNVTLSQETYEQIRIRLQMKKRTRKR
ncbi:unnamed protein product [Rotaria sordida]|uniref:Beta-1,4-galactosyltransferase n=1 Tax=Rotaria sordida TaxID=392033 RepID=A0A814RPY2_9BILA|nr:unnamed protein product [Rotaria sordida]